MKFRKISLILSGLVILAMLLLGLLHRRRWNPPPTADDEAMLGFSVRRPSSSADVRAIPSLDELEDAAKEILLIEPLSRDMTISDDMLTTARVISALRSSSGLAAGDVICLYESCAFYVRYLPESHYAGTIPEPGWISVDHDTLPLRQHEPYLVFLVPFQISPLYRKSDSAPPIFRYAYPCGSAFSEKGEGVLLSSPDPAEPSPLSAEMDDLLALPEWDEAQQARFQELYELLLQEAAEALLPWSQVRTYSYLTASEETADRLRELTAAVQEKYFTSPSGTLPSLP